MSNIKDNIFFKIATNKYFITVLVFVVLFLFVDENNLRVTRSLSREVEALKATVDTLKQGIVQDSIRAERLKDNMDSMERYGREKYFMKRQSEDVFVINRTNE